MAEFDQRNADRARKYYDALGDSEWGRLVGSPSARVALELHRRLLARTLGVGARVLEVGAGPGRFTIELARLGATIVVSDVSPVQLTLNKTYVTAAGAEAAVESRQLLDIADLSAIGNATFDAVVAYGGPLSYTFDRAEHALSECLRVARPQGLVVASVMSAIGSCRYYVRGLTDDIHAYGLDAIDHTIRTGEQRHGDHQCRMFRWSEIETMLSRFDGHLIAASASNALSTGDPIALAHLEEDSDLWSRFLDWEETLAQEPGSLDGGTHMLFAFRKS